MLSLISLISFNITQAQTATNRTDACNNLNNGSPCKYTQTVNSPTGPATKTEEGFCDRDGGGINPTRLVCKTGSEANGWKDCFRNTIVGDACMINNELGVCKGYSINDCDTTKKPTGNPGGSTPATCGSSTCPSGKVCVNNNENKPTCVNDIKGNDGKCGSLTCPPDKVCVNNNENKPTCTNNASTPGTPANTTPTDATAPQTVGFINPIRFNSLTELIAGIINALLGILGAITVAVLVMSGFKYMISSNPGEVGQALDGIRNAIVGLMIIMGAFLITQYVISALAA
ncbi:hypothetical protein EBU71_15970 [bacterium]|nr:hypothetical protein [Candidatus Elulimicrobium humile]